MRNIYIVGASTFNFLSRRFSLLPQHPWRISGLNLNASRVLSSVFIPAGVYVYAVLTDYLWVQDHPVIGCGDFSKDIRERNECWGGRGKTGIILEKCMTIPDRQVITSRDNVVHISIERHKNGVPLRNNRKFFMLTNKVLLISFTFIYFHSSEFSFFQYIIYFPAH